MCTQNIITRFAFGLCVVAALCISTQSFADTVTLRGSTIPLRGCSIQNVAAGQVIFLDSRGRRQSRPLNEIASVGFNDLPQLDQAEDAWREGELDRALMLMLQAHVAATDDLPRLWTRKRLAELHDQRGEYIPAAGHVAAVIRMNPHRTWRDIVPLCEPSDASVSAVIEAMREIQRARAEVHNNDLTTILNEMANVVAPMAERLGAASGIAADTVSGFARDVIAAGTVFENAQPVVIARTQDPAPIDEPAIIPDARPTRPTGTPFTAPSLNDLSPDAIGALIDAEKFAEARRRCERIAEAPGDRNLATFLYQYGRALQETDAPRDAAVMYTRCVVFHPETADAVRSLMQTAVIYRRVFDRPETAQRLLEKAEQRAMRIDQPELAASARRVADAMQ